MVRTERAWYLALTAMVAAAYARVIHAGFVWDDNAHVVGAGLGTLRGLARIWAEPGATQQYYPVSYSFFWLEWRLWRDAPAGYHCVNVLLHAAVACLLFRALRTLAVPGAHFGAALFALHPICVESVAWVSEQKNTLSAVFYLLAGLSYLRFDRTRGRSAYAAAAGLFILALLAKSVTATLPAALLVVFWWRRGRLRWRDDVLALGPWLLAGLGMGRLTAWVERTYVAGGNMGYHLTAGERGLIAGRALWFYLGKLLWPGPLVFIYPRWTIESGDPRQWLGPVAAIGVLAGLWAFRRKSRGPLASALLFAGTLVPALGFVDVFPFQYSFVADHFQYLAAALALSALAAGLVVASRGAAMPRGAAAVAGGMVLAILGATTWRQTATYRDSPTLWRATLERNPDCWMAWNNLGVDLLAAGRTDEAVASIRRSLGLRPENAAAHVNLADALRRQGDGSGAESEYRAALKLDPGSVLAHTNYGVLLYDTGRAAEAMAHYRLALAAKPDYALALGDLGDALMSLGRLDEAVAIYRKAMAQAPDDARTETNLGTAFLRLGRGPEAIAAYEAAIRLQPGYAIARLNLGNAWLFAGRSDEAIASYCEAVRLDPTLRSAHNNLGYALLRAQRPKEAMVSFLEELKLDPTLARTDRGYALLQEGRADEALGCFRAALERMP